MGGFINEAELVSEFAVKVAYTTPVCVLSYKKDKRFQAPSLFGK